MWKPGSGCEKAVKLARTRSGLGLIIHILGIQSEAGGVGMRSVKLGIIEASVPVNGVNGIT
jgi:hypothetical protein